MFSDNIKYNLFQIFYLLIFILVLPIVILIVTSLFIHQVIYVLSIFLPDEILSILMQGKPSYLVAGFFLGLILLPLNWSKLQIDFIGEPKYSGFYLKKFIIKIFIIPNTNKTRI